MFPWLVLGEEMEVVRSHPHRDHRTSRTRCVWGNTVVPELPFPPQRARPFHSHSIQTQASPFHLSRGVIRSITLVFWVGHLFQPFVIVWCVDYLFGRGTGPNQSFRHWHRNLLKIVFTVTGLPDAFQPTPCVGFVEVRHRGPLDLVRAPWVFVRYRACFLGGQVLGDFPGLCKILHETTRLVGNHMGFPSCLPVFSLGW